MDLQKKDKTLQYCLREGTILDHYMLKQVIEIGGYGIVYRALDLRLQKEVAIKEFFPAFLVNRSLQKGNLVSLKSDMSGALREMEYEMELEQFLQEARWMAGLADIVEVVRVTDLFEANNTAYLVMDDLRGKNLKQMLIEHRGRIPSAVLLPSMEALVKALGKIHARGLLHRDLSPDNIMILEDGSIRLIDFGNASNMHDKTFARIALKHGFAAPELYGEEEQSTYTDVYGLCATMYYCLSGKLPIPAQERLAGKELLSLSQLGVDISTEWEQVIMDGLALSIQERIPTMEELWERMYR